MSLSILSILTKQTARAFGCLALGGSLALATPAAPVTPPVPDPAAAAASNPAPPAPLPPIYTALISGNVGYWRLASFVPPKDWASLATELSQWNAQGAVGLVLDLRSNQVTDDLTGAAQIAGLFSNPGTTLFVLGSGAPTAEKVFTNPHAGDPMHEPLVILTNGETSGAAEALAAYLQANGAIVMGRPTAGKASVAPAVLRLGSGAEVTGHAVKPDLLLTIDDKTEQNALVLISQHDVNDVIQEISERKRMSEAALVQGEDPELDNYLVSREKLDHARLSSAALVQDLALIQAVDSLKAIRLSQRTVEPPPVAQPPAPPSTIQ